MAVHSDCNTPSNSHNHTFAKGDLGEEGGLRHYPWIREYFEAKENQMAHVLPQMAIGQGARLWLQAYDEKEYAMVLMPVTVDDISSEGVLFQSERGLTCGWCEDYNYRFGWRCWDRMPTSEEMITEPWSC